MHNPWPKVVCVTAYMANKSEKSPLARLLGVHALYKHASYRHDPYGHAGHKKPGTDTPGTNTAPPPLRIDRTDGGAGKAACR
ncbi:hypothetical protein GCM10009646_31690 [Streptomyces aureus]